MAARRPQFKIKPNTHLSGQVLSNKYIGPKPPSAPSPYTPVASGANNIGTQQPKIPESDPRDAGYFNDVAKLNQYYESNKAGLTSSLQELSRNLVKNQGLLKEQQPRDELSAKTSANKAGLFYSGALGKNLGDIATSYARRRSDLQTEFESNKDKIAGQLQDLETNYGPSGLLRNDALLSGIGRATANDQANALAYAPQNAAAPASVPFRTEAGTSKAGVPGVWHIYPGGRRVFVRK